MDIEKCDCYSQKGVFKIVLISKMSTKKGLDYIQLPFQRIYFFLQGYIFLNFNF